MKNEELKVESISPDTTINSNTDLRRKAARLTVEGRHSSLSHSSMNLKSALKKSHLETHQTIELKDDVDDADI